jgi:putative sigma-54 modulation protein
VSVTFRHVDPSAGLRSYASEKVERLEKFARRVINAHVILSVEKQRHRAEIQISGRDLQLTATEETGDLYSAIDLAADKVERQLKKLAEKRKGHKGAPSAAGPPPATRKAAARSDGRIRPRRVAVKALSVDEALAEIEASANEFVLFRNSTNDAVSVLYRRKDGSYGLLEAEPA